MKKVLIHSVLDVIFLSIFIPQNYWKTGLLKLCLRDISTKKSTKITTRKLPTSKTYY